MTLIELLCVLAVLVMLTAIIAPKLSKTSEDARMQTTLASLRELQTVIANRFVLDMRGLMLTSTSQAVIDGLPGPHPDHLLPTTRQQRPQLQFLFVNPITNNALPAFDPVSARGWRGPYLLAGRGTYPGVDAATAAARGFDDIYGVPGDLTVLDGWGNPLVIQATTLLDAMLVSAGPDGSLLTTSDNVSVALR